MEPPSEIRHKLDEVIKEVKSILEIAGSCIQIDVSGQLKFTFSISAPREVLIDIELAQSTCFLTRFKAMPVFERVSVKENNGSFYFDNIDESRYVLNEYRSIIHNINDSIHFQKIHKFCREKLINNDHTKDLTIVVNHKERGDITHEFVKHMDERYKAFKSVIKHCEFDYIYNGILQHSDHKYTERFRGEYTSGKVNYVFAKHAYIVGYIRWLMETHYKLLSVTTFPKLGPL
jgi:hypothetical protein